MIEFPTATNVYRRMPKEAFYKHLSFTKVLKEKFISDVDRIIVENSLTKENLNLATDSEIKEILLLSISLKRREFDGKVVEAIAKQNPHKLVFLLSFEDSRQLALYHGKLYRTGWMSEAETNLRLQGLSLDAIWEAFVEQIALHEESSGGASNLSLDERLAIQGKIDKLEKLIAKTENAVWKEQQPKKQFELYTRLQGYKQELGRLKKSAVAK